MTYASSSFCRNTLLSSSLSTCFLDAYCSRFSSITLGKETSLVKGTKEMRISMLSSGCGKLLVHTIRLCDDPLRKSTCGLVLEFESLLDFRRHDTSIDSNIPHIPGGLVNIGKTKTGEWQNIFVDASVPPSHEKDPKSPDLSLGNA